MTSSDPSPYLAQLHRLCEQFFTLEDIQTLSLDLNIDFESVPGGDVKSARIRGLLLGVARQGRLPELLALAAQKRPAVPWPPLPEDFKLPTSLETLDFSDSGRQATINSEHIEGDKYTWENISGSNIVIGRNAQATFGGPAERPIVDFNALFAPLLLHVTAQAPADTQAALIDQIHDLQAQVALEAAAPDETIADLVADIAAALPTAVPLISALFAKSAVASAAGPATTFILKRIQRPE